MTTIRKALALLGAAERRRWMVLVPLAVAGALAEAAGAAALYVLIRLIGDPDAAARLPLVARFGGGRKAVVGFAVALAVFYLAKNAFQAWLAWLQSGRIAEGRAALAARALAVYLGAPWTFHLQRNSAELIRNVNGAVDGVFRGVLGPAVALAAESLVALAIGAVLVVMSPGVMLALAVLLGGAGAVFLRATRSRATRWGRRQHELERTVLQGVRQTLGAVKEIKVLGREALFLDEFARRQRELVEVRHLHDMLSVAPRLLVEAVFVLGAFALVVVLVTLGRDRTAILPLLGLYAYAGFRVIPSANRILMHANEIRAAAPAVATLHRDLLDAPPAAEGDDATSAAPLDFADRLVLERVGFAYDGAARPALAGVDLTIRRGESVGIVGTTGAGKSTLVDLVIGLLVPTAGRITVDGKDLRAHRRAWQHAIGYVPQAVVLIDDTLRRNVALGVADDRVDDGRLREALRMAQLDDVVAGLRDGVATTVGERGVRLSGGQRQRVGIARALYHRPPVLVFDEATSALDATTEADLQRAIEALGGTRTLVVVAHRLGTVRFCDRIVVLADGRVAAEGPWDELVRTSDDFRRLVAAEPSA